MAETADEAYARLGASVEEPVTTPSAPVSVSGGETNDVAYARLGAAYEQQRGQAFGEIRVEPTRDPAHLTQRTPIPPDNAGFFGRIKEAAKGVGSLATGAAKFLLTTEHEVGPKDRQIPAAIGQDIINEGGLLTWMTGILGPEFKKTVQTGSFDPLMEDPGATVADLLMGFPALVAPATGVAATAVRGAHRVLAAGKLGAGGEKVAARASDLWRGAIPKAGWTDPVYANEGLRQGGTFAEQVTTVRDAIEESESIIKQYPHAGPQFAPKIIEEVVGGLKTGNLIADTTHAVMFSALPPDVQRRIANIRTLIDSNHQELLDRGILKGPGNRNRRSVQPGTYLPQLYEAQFDTKGWAREVMNNRPWLAEEARNWMTSHLIDPVATNHLGTPVAATVEQADNLVQRILAAKHGADDVERLLSAYHPNVVQRLLARQHMPEPIRQLMGPLDPSKYSLAVGTALDSQTKMLFNDAAISRMQTLTDSRGQPFFVARGPKTIIPGPDYVQLPNDSLAYGRWAGGYAHKDIVDSMYTFQGDHLSGPLQRFFSAWRAGVVPWNPKTSVNNIVGDVMFSHVVGASALNPANTPSYAKALTELVGFGARPGSVTTKPDLLEAMRLGAVVPGFAGTEIESLYLNLGKHMTTFGQELRNKSFVDLWTHVLTRSSVGKTVLKAYDLEDQVFRYGAFLSLKAKGMTGAAAAVEVNKYFPNYAVTSQFGAFGRGQGKLGGVPGGAGPFVTSPFLSFPLEAARIFAIAAKEHPYRLMAAQSVPLSLTIANMGASGMTMDDYHRWRRGLPEYQRSKLWVPIKWGQNPEDTSWIDMSRMAPFMGLQSGPQASETLLNNPLLSTAVGLWTNTDLNRPGQPLWNEARGETFLTGMKKTLYNLAPVPSWAKQMNPAAETSRLRRSLADLPPRQFAETSESPAMSLLYNLLPEPISGEELSAQGRLSRGGIRGDIKRGFSSIGRSNVMTEDAKEREREVLRQQLLKQRSR